MINCILTSIDEEAPKIISPEYSDHFSDVNLEYISPHKIQADEEESTPLPPC
jgi:hypothetical protein